MNYYYQPSGRFSVPGVLLMLVGGLLAAVPLAFAYVYAIWYIPLIYVNFLVTLGFGLGLGWVLKRLVKLGKIRNPKLVGWLSFGVGVWAWYVQWCVYLTLLAGAGETESFGSRASITHTSFEPEFFLGALGSPVAVLGMLPKIAENGTWSIFGVGVSGIFLYLIWLIEFGAITLFSTTVPLDQASTPFSETALEWAEKTTLPQSAAPFYDPAATRTALEAANWQHLQLLPADAEPAPFGRLHVYQSPKDPDCCYLSLENVTIERDKNGKPSEKTTDVVQYLRLSPVTCQELHARFGTASTVSA